MGGEGCEGEEERGGRGGGGGEEGAGVGEGWRVWGGGRREGKGRWWGGGEAAMLVRIPFAAFCTADLSMIMLFSVESSLLLRNS